MWLFSPVSPLLPSKLRSSGSNLPSARSIRRKHSFLLAHLPVLGIDSTAPSLPMNAPRLLSTAIKDYFRRVLTTLAACIFVSDSRCVGCKAPSLFRFFVELLLHLVFSHSVLKLRRRYPKHLCTFSCTSSLCSTSTHSIKYHLTIWDSSLTSVSSCILVICPLLY